jgi:hypothetical protein
MKLLRSFIRGSLALQDDCTLSAVGRCSLQDCSMATYQAGASTSKPHQGALGWTSQYVTIVDCTATGPARTVLVLK